MRRRDVLPCPPHPHPLTRAHLAASVYSMRSGLELWLPTHVRPHKRPQRWQSAPPRGRGHGGAPVSSLCLGLSPLRQLAELLPGPKSERARAPQRRGLIHVQTPQARSPGVKWDGASGCRRL